MLYVCEYNYINRQEIEFRYYKLTYGGKWDIYNDESLIWNKPDINLIAKKVLMNRKFLFLAYATIF